MNNTLYLTTPIYYVNAKPHIGHAYTTVATDMVARYWRSRGMQVRYQTGTDEHGAKNAEKAEEAGVTPQVYVDQMSATFSLAWDRLGIEVDSFWRTTSPEHVRRAQMLLQELYDRGYLYEARYSGLYCRGCERFLTEKELVQGVCPDHKIQPESLSEDNWFFKLGEFLPRIEQMVRTGEIRIEPESIRSEVLGLFTQNLEDFSVSRERVTWGVPLPFADGQVAYVWVEALLNYVTGLEFGEEVPSEELQKFWPNVVHVVGKDIIKFHCVYWPALLLALGIDPPKRVFAHGFFTIDGQKMSKSIGNVIDPNDLVDRYGSDGARYLLLTQFPFGSDGDVKAATFDQQYNTVLANNVGNLVHRVTSMTEKYLSGEVAADAVQNDTAVLLAFVKDLDGRVEQAFEAFRPDLALQEVLHLVDRANAYIEEVQPWNLAKEERSQQQLEAVLAELLGALHVLSALLYPFLPEASLRISDRIGFTVDPENEHAGRYVVTVGDPLFPRIEDAVE